MAWQKCGNRLSFTKINAFLHFNLTNCAKSCIIKRVEWCLRYFSETRPLRGGLENGLDTILQIGYHRECHLTEPFSFRFITDLTKMVKSVIIYENRLVGNLPTYGMRASVRCLPHDEAPAATAAGFDEDFRTDTGLFGIIRVTHQKPSGCWWGDWIYRGERFFGWRTFRLFDK